MREVYLRLWLFIAAAVIVFYGGTHLVIMHLDDFLSFFGTEVEPLAWSSVAQRASSVWWKGFYGILAAAALSHGFLGLRTMILELSPPPRAVRVLNWALIAFGIAAFAFAMYTLIIP